MKKVLPILVLCLFLLSACGVAEEPLSTRYAIGDEVELGGKTFNIYKINDSLNTLQLLAQDCVAITAFSDDTHCGYDPDVYDGSLVEDHVDRFVDDLEDRGVSILSSGIIDYDDLYAFGFENNGALAYRRYKYTGTYSFINHEQAYWADGYSRYETYAWSYTDGILELIPCDTELGVRPVIEIDPEELTKEHAKLDPSLTVQEIADTEFAWIGEGGFSNPYDRYIFDFENMLFIYHFESPDSTQTIAFAMDVIDDKTIHLSGVRPYYGYPTELTIVSAEKIRVRAIDEYEHTDHYLLLTDEIIDPGVTGDTPYYPFP